MMFDVDAHATEGSVSHVFSDREDKAVAFKIVHRIGEPIRIWRMVHGDKTELSIEQKRGYRADMVHALGRIISEATILMNDIVDATQ